MSDLAIKEISEITVLDENNNKVRKTRMVISQNGIDTEIILEGNGSVKVATAV